MNTSRVATLGVVVLLIAAGGLFGLRSWVGIDAGEEIGSNGAESTSTPSGALPEPEEPPEPDPDPTPTPSEEPTPEPTPDRSDSEASMASPSGIAADIEARLDRSGPKTSVTCPQAVPTSVGTSFRCTVSYAEDPTAVVADAQVNLVGSGLRYVWRSVPR